MSEIEKQMERERKFIELVGLLEKIYKYGKAVKLEINFDGEKFASWGVYATNLTAEDWNPNDTFKKGSDDPRQSRPGMNHRRG